MGSPTHILPILAIAVASNLDNIGVGLAYGTRKLRLPFLSNLVIAFITSCGTLLSMMLGRDLITRYLNEHFANYFGSSLIVLIGIHIGIQAFRQQRPPVSSVMASSETGPAPDRWHWWQELIRLNRAPEKADRDHSGCIDLKEATILGFALTLNNLPNGFAAGILRLSTGLTTTMVFLFSLLTFWVGINCGRRYISRLGGKWAGLVASLMLVLVGLYEMLQ